MQDHLLLPGYAGYPNTAAVKFVSDECRCIRYGPRSGRLVGAVHPFDGLPDPFAKPTQQITDELPVDVALGKLDYMEIVGFSDHKSTAAVWYRLLEPGIQIPAGGGTDATTDYAAPIRGQVGFRSRLYVCMRVGPCINVAGRIEDGRSFATNGPLARIQVGRRNGGQRTEVRCSQREFPSLPSCVRSCPSIISKSSATVKVSNSGAHGPQAIPPISPDRFRFTKVAGASCARGAKGRYPVMDKYAYATTSPVYVAIAGKRAYSKEDAKYFKAWIDRTIEITDQYPDWNSAEEKQLVLKRLDEARAVYEKLPLL